jgi:iron(III) transport system substrate-binding protein
MLRAMPIYLRTVLCAVLALGVAALLLLNVRPARSARQSVVVYTSVDEEFALPLFKRFTEQTGIGVIHRIDGESVKTTAFAQRLEQLKDNPDGDVFWNSEMSFTQVLANRGVLQDYVSPQAADIPASFKDARGVWTGFGCRARVLIYNTNKVKPGELPKTFEALAQPRWKGRFCIAKPLYGTTRSHLVSFVIALGEEKAFHIFRAWRDNGLVLAASNGDVRDLVASGVCDVGITDTDDVFSAIDRNRPVAHSLPSQAAGWPGIYLIPNTVSMLANCPHPAEARAFIDFLLNPQTEAFLAAQGARQIPVRADIPAPHDLTLKTLTPAVVPLDKLAEQVLPLGERIYHVLNGDTP